MNIRDEKKSNVKSALVTDIFHSAMSGLKTKKEKNLVVPLLSGY